jgi:mono/diheme cytochrome c family protein
MKTVKRILVTLCVLVLVLVVYVQLGYKKKFNDIPYPDVKASKDSAVIARGKYLVFGPAHCAMCHIDVGQDMLVDAGKELPLVGGMEMHIPVGIIRPANLTSDKETGIGTLTDGQIARMMRYNVKRDGEAAIPFMPFQEMSDEDMTAVISYLRTLPPVKHEVPSSSYNLIGKIVKTFVLKPSMPQTQPPKMVMHDTSVAYGNYMTHSVANCYGCHTDRDLRTGEFTGKPFAGGLIFAPVPETFNRCFMTPNLTPDKATGRMADWELVTFMDRMHKGRLQKGSPMPWGPFSRMDDNDLKAIYNYLRTVPSVNNDVTKTAFDEGEKMPEPKVWKQ